MLLCAITDRSLLGEEEAGRREKLVALVSIWAENNIDFIQIREKNMPERELIQLASRIVRATRRVGNSPRVLINATAEAACRIALNAGADGVHLRGDLSPHDGAAAIAQIHNTMGDDTPVSVACHSVAEVEAARNGGATLALFAPVFEKPLPHGSQLPGRGLESLSEACRIACQPSAEGAWPVLALGGVTAENAPRCFAAGAAGIAGIRLFLNEDHQLQARLRVLKGNTGRFLEGK